MGVVEAVIASAILTTGGAVYSAKKSASAQKKAQEAQERAQAEADAEAERIAKETKPTEASATLEVSGTTDLGEGLQTTADFLIPKQASLGSTGGTGLGFSV